MSDQSTAAAERSAHVTRDARQHAEQTCCVCGGPFKTCSHAARVGPPLMQVCSAKCAQSAPFSVSPVLSHLRARRDEEMANNGASARWAVLSQEIDALEAGQ